MVATMVPTPTGRVNAKEWRYLMELSRFNTQRRRLTLSSLPSGGSRGYTSPRSRRLRTVISFRIPGRSRRCSLRSSDSRRRSVPEGSVAAMGRNHPLPVGSDGAALGASVEPSAYSQTCWPPRTFEPTRFTVEMRCEGSVESTRSPPCRWAVGSGSYRSRDSLSM